MIDDQGKRLSALRNRIPNSVLFTLFTIAVAAGAFAGYASGLDTQRTRVPVYAMGLLVSAVIYLIIDLDRPSAGFITNNQQPMIDLAASIASFSGRCAGAMIRSVRRGSKRSRVSRRSTQKNAPEKALLRRRLRRRPEPKNRAEHPTQSSNCVRQRHALRARLRRIEETSRRNYPAPVQIGLQLRTTEAWPRLGN